MIIHSISKIYLNEINLTRKSWVCHWNGRDDILILCTVKEGTEIKTFHGVSTCCVWVHCEKGENSSTPLFQLQWTILQMQAIFSEPSVGQFWCLVDINTGIQILCLCNNYLRVFTLHLIVLPKSTESPLEILPLRYWLSIWGCFCFTSSRKLLISKLPVCLFML